MSDERYDTDTTPGQVDGPSDEAQTRRFQAFLALGLGVLAALGGGVVGAALQWWAFASETATEETAAAVQGGVPVVLGLAAVVLGLQAARGADPLDAPVGKVGAVLGALAVLGGMAYAVALLTQ